MSLRNLVVVGAGGFARELRWLVSEMNRQREEFNVLGFVVSDTSRLGPNDSSDEVLGDLSWLQSNRGRVDALCLGIGTPAARLKVAHELEQEFSVDYFPAIIHPTVRMDEQTCEIGAGAILAASTILTVNVRIHPFSLLNLACTVGHEAEIGRGAVLNPGVNVSGGVSIGAGVLVGTGAQVLQYIEVGNDSVIGAGAVVTSAVEAGQTVVGIPARPIVNKR